MAAITINIPDAVLPRVLDAFAAQYGWAADLEVTKAQFAKARMIDFVRATVRTEESDVAGRVARDAAAEKVNAEIVLS